MSTRGILVTRRFASPDDCLRLIQLYERYAAIGRGSDGNGNRVVRSDDIRSGQAFVRAMATRCLAAVKTFFHARPLYLESCFLARLLPGQHHSKHADNARLERGVWVPNHTPQRHYSLLLYLNDEFRGGTLSLPELGVRIVPEPGLLVAFPSDHRFLHRVGRVTAGSRYSVAMWFTRSRGFAMTRDGRRASRGNGAGSVAEESTA